MFTHTHMFYDTLERITPTQATKIGDTNDTWLVYRQCCAEHRMKPRNTWNMLISGLCSHIHLFYDTLERITPTQATKIGDTNDTWLVTDIVACTPDASSAPKPPRLKPRSVLILSKSDIFGYIKKKDE